MGIATGLLGAANALKNAVQTGSGYYDPNKDYSKELQRTDLTTSQRAQMETERQNKINDKYGGVEPNLDGKNYTYSSKVKGGSGSYASSGSGSYVPLDASGNDYAAMAGMSALDLAALQAAKNAYYQGRAAGNQTMMNAAHQQAESIRKKYNYSGGADGSQYIALQDAGLGDLMNFEDYWDAAGYGNAMGSMSAANDAYLQQMEADAAAQRKQMQQEFDDAARQAYIANMERRRTLPQRMSAAGMNGGLADSQEIALDAELQNNQAQLDSGRASALQQLQNILSQNKLTAQQNYLGNLAGLQQNAAAGYQDFYRNTADRILQNFYSQQELAQATEQQKWDRAYALLQSMGYADDKIAQILGVAPGNGDMDRDLAEAQLQVQMGKLGLL